MSQDCRVSKPRKLSSATPCALERFVSKHGGITHGHNAALNIGSPYPVEATKARIFREDLDTAAESLERFPGVPITGCFETETPTEPTVWFNKERLSHDVGCILVGRVYTKKSSTNGYQHILQATEKTEFGAPIRYTN